MNYKVTVDGKEIEYGALVEKSRFSDEEWSAIMLNCKTKLARNL